MDEVLAEQPRTPLTELPGPYPSISSNLDGDTEIIPGPRRSSRVNKKPERWGNKIYDD